MTDDDVRARMEQLAEKWDRDHATDPTTTIHEAKFAAKALEMCTRELRDALAEVVPPDDLPATLNGVDDVRQVCEAAGLTTVDQDRAWQTPDVLVMTDHDVLNNLLTGYHVYRAGNDDEPLVAIQPHAPASLLWHAIQAARGMS